MKSSTNSIRPPELDGPAAGTWRSTFAWAWLLCGGLVAVALAYFVFGDMPGRLALGLSLTLAYAAWCLWRWHQWRRSRRALGPGAAESCRLRRSVIRHFVVVPLVAAVFIALSVIMRFSTMMKEWERCDLDRVEAMRAGIDCRNGPQSSMFMDLPFVGLAPGLMALGPIALGAATWAWIKVPKD